MANQIKPKEQKIIQQAQTLISQGDTAAAKDLLLVYNKNNKSSEHIHYYLCLSMAVLGELDKTFEPANKLAKKHPDNIEYLKLFGSICHGLKKYGQAIKAFQRALKLNNLDFQTLSNIASSLKETDQLEEAELYYKKSLAIESNQPDALTNYGLLLQTNARLDEAIAMHNKTLQLAPQHYVAMYNLAHVLNEKGDKDTALQMYSNVIAVTPSHVRALSDMAHIYRIKKQYDKAITCLQSAVSADPDDENTHLALANTYKDMKEMNLAESSFNEVFRINPNNEVAKYYLATLKGDNSITSSPDKYVEELFDSYAETFDEQLVGQLQYKTPLLIGDMVKKHIDASKKYKILDLGCGTGLAGIYLDDISDYKVGVDLSKKMIIKAEQRNIYDELIVSGINEYFDDTPLHADIVVAADVFVYVGDLAEIFSNVSKSLQNSGIFVFSTEDAKNTDTFSLRDSGRFAHNENYIQSLAKRNGLVFIDNKETIIRYDRDKPIHGQVYLLRLSTN